MITPKLSVVSSQPTKRIPRRPQHSFQLRTRPYQIQPFLLAPVLAGETMKNLLMQARVVTDPIKNPLIGWWTEYYFFYVRLRDLTESEDIQSMLLDLSFDTSGLKTGTANVAYYHHAGIDWTAKCLDRVVDEYFRDSGEAVDVAHLDNVPIAQINGKTWMDSVYGNAEMPTSDLGDDDTTDNEANIPADEFERRYQTWLFLRNQKMTEMDFEDYLASFGVRRTLAEKNKPELIRFVREWSYPSNTIDPTDGDPSSAVSWSVQERADKDRFFAEPGFVFGVTVARPKIYMSGQRESAAHLLDDALAWLPAIMRDDVSTSLKQVAATEGPLGGVHTANPYWVDVRDLFVYGDQFVNFALSETDAGLVALPKTTNSASRYAASADVDALFASASPANKIRQDGVVNLTILGTQQDHT